MVVKHQVCAIGNEDAGPSIRVEDINTFLHEIIKLLEKRGYLCAESKMVKLSGRSSTYMNHYAVADDACCVWVDKA
jgi:hypothetical protein